MTGKEVIAKLKAAGWKLDRVHGSHHVMTKGGQAVPVPVHMALAISEPVCSLPFEGSRASISSEAHYGNSLPCHR